MNNVVSLRFTGERARQPKGGSNGQALSVWNPETTQPDGQRASNQRSFERLEAEHGCLSYKPLWWCTLVTPAALYPR